MIKLRLFGANTLLKLNLKMNKLKSTLIIFIAGFIEQFGYTLYLIAMNRYLIVVSSVVLFVYFAVYLWIIDRVIKDKNSFLLLITYALSAALSNALAMQLHLIK